MRQCIWSWFRCLVPRGACWLSALVSDGGAWGGPYFLLGSSCGLLFCPPFPFSSLPSTYPVPHRQYEHIRYLPLTQSQAISQLDSHVHCRCPHLRCHWLACCVDS